MIICINIHELNFTLLFEFHKFVRHDPFLIVGWLYSYQINHPLEFEVSSDIRIQLSC